MQIFPVTSIKDEVAFFKLTLFIYRNDANWIQPLDKDVEEVFNPKKKQSLPFWKTAKMGYQR